MIEDEKLDLFIPIVGDVAAHDQQEVMMYPFFSLSKGRTKPIIYHSGENYIEISANPNYGMATIWDYDILIYAASKIIDSRNKGLETSRKLRVPPYDILKFTQRGTSGKDYQQLRDAFNRLQSTTVVTSIRQGNKNRRRQFSWINEWEEITDRTTGKPLGIEFIVSDWFYEGVINNRLVLTITSAYFELTKGYERWLYRIARKHGGKQTGGWKFTLKQLHYKSGSPRRFSHFCNDITKIVEDGIPEYDLYLYNVDGELTLYFSRKDVEWDQLMNRAQKEPKLIASSLKREEKKI